MRRQRRPHRTPTARRRQRLRAEPPVHRLFEFGIRAGARLPKEIKGILEPYRAPERVVANDAYAAYLAGDERPAELWGSSPTNVVLQDFEVRDARDGIVIDRYVSGVTVTRAKVHRNRAVGVQLSAGATGNRVVESQINHNGHDFGGGREGVAFDCAFGGSGTASSPTTPTAASPPTRTARSTPATPTSIQSRPTLRRW